MTQSDRTSAFQRNARLEALLKNLNTSIAGTTMPGGDTPSLAPLFILGTPRSGTTYCMQWLAASGAFSYPSNFIARFWRSPFIGAMTQQMLTDPDFDFRGEFSDVSYHGPEQNSELGKTRGLLAPNEFWYFWRAIFPDDKDIGIDLTRATVAQFEEFSKKLRELSSVRARPVATKGMIINHQLDSFAANMPEAVFLNLDRDPAHAAWSLLRARERMHGDENTWYSFRTPNHEALKAFPAPEQVMGQIETIRSDLHKQLNALPKTRWLTLDYAELCGDPNGSFEKLRALYAKNGLTLEGANTLPPTNLSVPAIPEDVAMAFKDYQRR